MRLDKFKVIEPLFQREFDPKETMLWLKHNMQRYWCWGVSKTELYQNKGLFLHVNGRHHKGKVLITLAWNDTYTVTLINTQNNVKKTIEMVYCDQLAEIIDKEIEYIPAYGNN